MAIRDYHQDERWVNKEARELLSLCEAIGEEGIRSRVALIGEAGKRAAEEAMRMAAMSDGEGKIRALSRAGVSVEAKDERKRHPLMLAAQHGATRAIRALIEEGASADLAGFAGRTAAHAAAQNGQLGALEELERCGADLDKPDGEGTRPLSLAAWMGARSEVGFLLRWGAQIDAVNASGETALIMALRGVGDCERVCHDLIAAGASMGPVGRKEETPLMWAVGFGGEAESDEMIQAMLRAGADPRAMSQEGETALRKAIRHDSPSAVELLVKAGADLHARKTGEASPMEAAALELESESMVRWLLSLGADPRKEGKLIEDLSQRKDEASQRMLGLLEARREALELEELGAEASGRSARARV